MRSPSTPRSRRATAAVLAALLVAAALAAIAAIPASAAGTAHVRINQLGYPTTSAKRAYLMSSDVETGATFAVRQGTTTVLEGDVGADLGAWSSAYPHVYAIDFTDLEAAGTYTIHVAGPITAVSPAFPVGPGTALYAGALANARSFYQVQRDGAKFVPSALRTEGAHLHDATAMTYLTPHANMSGHFKGDLSPLGVTIDASGGWWDAGDYLKFLQTSSYTEGVLLAGIRDLPAQMGAGAGSFTTEAKFGIGWLLRMWDDPSRTLYYQVGIGTGNAKIRGDHDIWRLPQDDDGYGGNDPLYRYIRNRPVFRAGPPGSPISPNLAGRDAAAFGLCFQVFHVSAPALAAKCLRAGEHIFDLANTDPTKLLTVIPYSFYPESEWRDDLEWGATELARAVALGGLPTGVPHTSAAYYRTRAAHWANEYMLATASGGGDTLNLYDVSGLAHFSLHRALTDAGSLTGLETTPDALVADLKRQLDGAIAQGATDPFGFGFPWDSWDTTTHGAGLAVMAAEYDTLVGEGTYAQQELGWLSNILGANGWGTSFIVGDGAKFPHCLQHQVANIVGSLRGTAPVLAGAAVEGPNGVTYSGSLLGMRPCPANGVDRFAPFNGKTAVFLDDVESFSTTEPAVDLTATSPLAFAWEMHGTPPPSSGGGGGGGSLTTVTIQFDDSNADQLLALVPLQTRGMTATFYVNSGFVGDATHLSVADLQALYDAGNEIAGHTIDHANVKKLKTADARAEVCGDRVTIMGWGFPATSFAYPFGSYDADSEAVVRDCGYNSGRGVSGVDDTKTYAETIPPPDPYGLRMTPSIKQGTTVETVEGYVTAAETHGGGWVQLLIHHLCQQCDPYSMTPADFATFLDWLQGEVDAGRVVVRTTDDVIGGDVQPPVQP